MIMSDNHVDHADLSDDNVDLSEILVRYFFFHSPDLLLLTADIFPSEYLKSQHFDQLSKYNYLTSRQKNLISRYNDLLLICQIIVSTCQITMLTCEIIMLLSRCHIVDVKVFLRLLNCFNFLLII